MNLLRKHFYLLFLTQFILNASESAQPKSFFAKLKATYLNRMHVGEKKLYGSQPAPECVKQHVYDALRAMGDENPEEVPVLEFNNSHTLTGLTTKSGIWVNKNSGEKFIIRVAYHEAAHWKKNHPHKHKLFYTLFKTAPYLATAVAGLCGNSIATKIMAYCPNIAPKTIFRGNVLSTLVSSIGGLYYYRNYLYQKLYNHSIKLRAEAEKEADMLCVETLIKNGKQHVLDDLIDVTIKANDILAKSRTYFAEQAKKQNLELVNDFFVSTLTNADMQNLKNILEFIEKRKTNSDLSSDTCEFNFKDVYPH